MGDRSKLFPLKLPNNYHGPVKQFKTPSQLYIQKSSAKEQGFKGSNKISNWKKKILDRDVVNERRQYLVHPAKISDDNPNWLKSTFHHFQRNYASLGKRESQQEIKKYDVFGNKRADTNRYSSENQVTFHKQKAEVTGKIGGVRDFNRRSALKIEVAGKVGAVETRQNLVKKPQLKVGSLYVNNFVDTYSVN